MTNQSPNSKTQTISVIPDPLRSEASPIGYCHSHESGNLYKSWIPAFARMTTILLSTSYYLLATNSPVFAQTTEAVDIGGNVKDFFGFTCIQHFIFRIVDIGIILSGLLLLIYLVWGGVEWLTSGGDKQKVADARNKLTNALIGVAIIAASYAIWRLALVFFGVDLTNICSSNPIPG